MTTIDAASSATLPLNFRFSVCFLGVTGPNPLDVRFQRVSGLSARIDTSTLVEGGENLYTHRLPSRVGYQNLVLERGFVVDGPLNLDITAAMSLFKFAPCDVLVTLLDAQGEPIAAWMFYKAWPVAWSTADLTVAKDDVLIDTIELAYTRMQAMRI